MKILKPFLLSISLMLMSVSAFAIDEIYTPLFSSLAVKGFDTVAYFTENKPVEGKKDHSLKWKGATWRFSSAENKALFEANPEKYAPQYGGYCAWAVSKNTTASIEPEQFSIVDGKLYLNYNKDIQEQWQVNKLKNIQTADKNWPGILAGN